MIRAVIFDWAGTTVDYGCQAPVAALKEAFAKLGVPLEDREARHSMGLLKIDHIGAILRLPRVGQAWRAQHGTEPDAAAAAQLFAEFGPAQMRVIEQHSDLIPTVPAVVTELRHRGIKIGATTGYTSDMLAPVLVKAKAQGYVPDAAITPDVVGAGRPKPWMIFENMRRLDVYPPRAVVKVGDTPSDIEEGQSAGVWTVAVVASSNEVSAYGPEEGRARLAAAKPDFLIDTLSQLPAILREIHLRTP